MDDLRTAGIEMTDQSKVISLFQFIQELNKLKQKAVLNIREYPWTFMLSSLPDDPDNIVLRYQDRYADDVEKSESDVDSVILSVHKPEFQKCPEPETSFELWLKPGWNDYHQEAAVLESMPGEETDPETDEPIPVLFTDNERRTEDYRKWLEVRSVWAERQVLTAQTQKLFTDLYRLYFEMKQESETE